MLFWLLNSHRRLLPTKVGGKKEQLCTIDPSAKLCTVLKVEEVFISIIITILWLWFHDDMHATSCLIIPIIQQGIHCVYKFGQKSLLFWECGVIWSDLQTLGYRLSPCPTFLLVALSAVQNCALRSQKGAAAILLILSSNNINNT